MTENNWKKRQGIVYSTNPEFQFNENDSAEEYETLPKEKQKLRVRIEKSGRNGKVVTIVTGFIGTNEDLKSLAKILKTKLCSGGSNKGMDIIIQGDKKAEIISVLLALGYVNTK